MLRPHFQGCAPYCRCAARRSNGPMRALIKRLVGRTIFESHLDEGVRYPWMTWDQVRSLHERGFEFGAHTRTHVDLGAVTDIEAREEILGARRELEERLGKPAQMFAYPYGRLINLADDNRRLIRGAGFRCCCSCFGGVIDGTTDPFHLRRVPISSRYPSPSQFGFEVALGRSIQAA